jgi:hypothetical protein
VLDRRQRDVQADWGNKGFVKAGDLVVISTTGEKIRGERKQSSEIVN